MLSEDLRKVYTYNAETGAILRKVRTGNHAAGTECISKCTNGYLKVTYKGTQILQHRLAWFLYYNEQPPACIDHINRNKTDNAIRNLRPATTSQNQMNIGVHTRSQTGVKGIMPIRNGALYRAEVCVAGVRHQKHSKSITKLQTWLESKRNLLHAEYAN